MLFKDIATIVTTFVIFVLLDSTYLFSMKKYFQTQVVEVQGTPLVINIYAAILCYIALVFGLYYFILRSKKSVLDAFLLGIVIYAVYETTTWALFKKWRPLTVVLDTLWGGVLFSLTTYIMYKLI